MSQPEVPTMPGQEPKRQSWSEYGKEKYQEQYDKWVPWLEDLYLRWFTKDNKASYTTKGTSRRLLQLSPVSPFPPPT